MNTLPAARGPLGLSADYSHHPSPGTAPSRPGCFSDLRCCVVASMKHLRIVIATALVAGSAAACRSSSSVDQFVRVRAPVVALTHVRVIDGTGEPGVDDQTVIIEDGRISTVGAFDTVLIPADARVLDLPGRTLIPGLVGMHNHLFYTLHQPSTGRTPMVRAQAPFAKLYLANGVTTIRTGGAPDFEADLAIKRLIDGGREAGPTIYITTPYLNAAAGASDPDRIARQIDDWADRGATSVKAYTSLRASELLDVVDAAHRRAFTSPATCAPSASRKPPSWASTTSSTASRSIPSSIQTNSPTRARLNHWP